jgi:hypothetical protein
MGRVLALDPGLGSFGAALFDESARLLDVDALATEVGEEVAATQKAKREARKEGRSAPRRKPGQKNSTTEQLEDRTRRVGEIWDWLDEFALGDDWIAPDVIVAEAGAGITPHSNSHAIVSLATGSTVVQCLAARIGVPVVWGTQAEWRRTFIPNPVSGRKGEYSQAEIANAVGRDVEERIKRKLRDRGKSISIRDHALDAVGLGRWAIGYSLSVQRALFPDRFI